MINNLIVFCENNHLRIFGMMCLCLAIFYVLSLLLYLIKKSKILKVLAPSIVFFGSQVLFIIKASLWTWLAMAIIIILDRILIF